MLGPIQTWNPSAGEYYEQKDGFAVFASRAPGTQFILSSKPTLDEAEELARSQVKNGQYDNAFVIPVKLACGMKRG